MRKRLNNIYRIIKKQKNNIVNGFTGIDENNYRTLNIISEIDANTVLEVNNFVTQILNDKYVGNILVTISSNGGSTDAATSIYQLLSSIDNKIITCVLDKCISSANIIFLATDYENRYVLENSLFLVHSCRKSLDDQYTLEQLNYSIDSLEHTNQTFKSMFTSKTSIPERILEDIYVISQRNRIFNEDEIQEFKIGKVISSINEIEGLKLIPNTDNKFQYFDLLDNCDILPPISKLEEASKRIEDIIFSSDKPIILPYFPILNMFPAIESKFLNTYKLSNKRILFICFGDMSFTSGEMLSLSDYNDRYFLKYSSIEKGFPALGIKGDDLTPALLKENYDVLNFRVSNNKKSLKKHTNIPEEFINSNSSGFIDENKFEEYGIGKVVNSLNEIKL